MPTYVYQCDKCGVQFEHRQRITDDPLQDCPECDGHVRRVLQPVGIVFKGSGWYCTDNRTKSSTALPGASKTADAGKGGEDESSAPAVEKATAPVASTSTDAD
jgi:putative FmdB family regulatory protein